MTRTSRFRSAVAAMALAAAAVFSAACSDSAPGVTGPVRAEVLVYDPAAAAVDERSTSFRMQRVTFETLESLESLAGRYFEIVGGGELYIKSIEGSQVQSDRFEGGGRPRLRYRLEDGVVIPRDYNTLLLLSAFYQFERVAKDMGEVTGIDADDFFKAMGLFKIMFEPRIRVVTDSSTLDASIKLNAAFVPGQKQFILFQRSILENVPLASNLQVIAHEFGHALFERTFFEKRFARCDEDETSSNRYFKGRFASEYAITGLNEGFSDIVSWGYTGSTDILRSSIDLGKVAEQRDFARTSFTFPALEADDDDVCSGRFYCIGTLFARSVRQAALASGVNTRDAAARRAVTKEVVQSVASAQAALRTFDSSILPPPSDTVRRCEVPDKIRTNYDGKVTGAFLAAFLAGVPQEKRAAYCKAFATNFGSAGFPEAARKDCP